jgi:HSP20 family molecular chaperone IbpA
MDLWKEVDSLLGSPARSLLFPSEFPAIDLVKQKNYFRITADVAGIIYSYIKA